MLLTNCGEFCFEGVELCIEPTALFTFLGKLCGQFFFFGGISRFAVHAKSCEFTLQSFEISLDAVFGGFFLTDFRDYLLMFGSEAI